MSDPFIAHADIVAFAEAHVNLPKDAAKKHRGQVNNLRENLERHISENPDFGLVKMLHAGSVAKGTALSTINDMDVVVYVKREQAPTDEGLVQWVGERLREAYPQKDPSDFDTSSPHCVRIHFRGSGLDVDVVPVLYDKNENDDGYLIDKYTGERLFTNIPRHLEFVRRRKRSNQQHFAQVVRLVKWWAKQRKDENDSFKCKSFLLELLVARMADSGKKLNDYPLALKEFFSYITRTGLEKRVAFSDYYNPDKIPDSVTDAIQVFDPVNPCNNVTSRYSPSDRSALVDAAQDAADSIREAMYSTTKERAVDSWQTVLGPSFRG